MQIVSKLKTLNDYLGDLVNGVKDTPWPEQIAEAFEWTAPLGEAFADVVPPVKVLIKWYEKATEIKETDKLCILFFNSVMQQSINTSLEEHKAEIQNVDPEKLKGWRPSQSEDPKQYHFQFCRFENLEQHPFVIDALREFRDRLRQMGLSINQTEQLVRTARIDFRDSVHFSLTVKSNLERFAPVSRLLADKNLNLPQRLLEEHAAYQCWLYEQQRILKFEPFALKDTYVEPECGLLTWEELKERRKANLPCEPFCDDPKETEGIHGGRQPLLDTVMSLLADPEFDDAIVIQGAPGSGKSSFTLRLCHELQQVGLSPIRIELKRVDFDDLAEDISTALSQAILLGDSHYNPNSNAVFQTNEDLLQGGNIFSHQERQFAYPESGENSKTASIQQYVLILDGWDEVSAGASDGFREAIENLLKEVRKTYLDFSQNAKVRIILCGRPTDTITKSRFMKPNTRLLTVRPLTPTQCHRFVSNLRVALRNNPLGILEEWEEWSLPTEQDLQQQILERYKQEFHKPLDERNKKTEALEIIGMPLLSLLAYRLMSAWDHSRLEELLDNSTLLYRSLVDMLMGGAKPLETEQETDESTQFRGDTLRLLLRYTAEFMTVLDQETLSHREWELRLEDQQMDSDQMPDLSEETFSRLMISFFFKEGHQELEEGNKAIRGIEFTHKSFREYLFAEQVVEVLKEFGTGNEDFEPLAKRTFWKDFDEQHDPRFRLSRRLTDLLGPQWLTTEVSAKISELLEWEITRSLNADPYPELQGGHRTKTLTPQQWERVRDALADLWTWWAEGRHMRSQILRSRRGGSVFEPPLIVEAAEKCRNFADELKEVRPVRLIGIDGHLGDGLYQLCCDVHRLIIDQQLIKNELEWSWTDEIENSRINQTKHELNGTSFYTFKPDAHPEDDDRVTAWKKLKERIDAAGYRELKRTRAFPYGIDYYYINLSGVNISRSMFREVNLINANLRNANLSKVDFRKTYLSGTILTEADLRWAILIKANLWHSDLSLAKLWEANLWEANLWRADLWRADLRHANLRHANFSEANLSQANLSQANLRLANFSLADLRGADLSQADLRNTRMSTRTQWSEIQLFGAKGVSDIIFLNDDPIHPNYGEPDQELRERFLDEWRKQNPGQEPEDVT